MVQSKGKEPTVSTLPWSAKRRPPAAGLCVSALLGYTGQSRKGKAHRSFSTRQLQMGLARWSLKPSDVSGVHMDTHLSELLVQTLLLLSGEGNPTRAYCTSLSAWHLSYRRGLCLCSPLITKGSRHRHPTLGEISSGNREDIPGHVSCLFLEH